MAGDLIPPHTYTSGDLLTAASLNDFLLEAKIKDEVVKFSHFTKEALEQLEDFFNKRRYKVGDIIVTKSEENPSVKFGGQWELLKDRFLLGAGGNYALNSTGGESNHTLTVDEMPSHTHNIVHMKRGDSDNGGDDVVFTKTEKIHNYSTESSGGGKSHNNMPPYIAVNIWIKISDEDDTTVS